MIGGNYQPYIKKYIEQSQISKDRLNIIECNYGPKPTNTIDLFIPNSASKKSPCPLMIFIHGGYWQELSKNESEFSALDFVANDIGFAAIDYSLCPLVNVSDIVNECYMAIRWLQNSFGNYNFNSEKMYISGSSAGAHLAAMCCLKALEENNKILAKLAGVVLVSGIYDLEPLVNTTINNSIGLDSKAAIAVSPLFKDLEGFPNTIIAWGENETEEFKKQSMIFSETLLSNQVNVQKLEIANRNHFDIILDLGKNDAGLGNIVINMIKNRIN
ncbi:MAG: alpha/beta hydrolase [Planktomarina sp.]|nr:alpha/beta hydrolase [Planktomarina sp.]